MAEVMKTNINKLIACHVDVNQEHVENSIKTHSELSIEQFHWAASQDASIYTCVKS